MEWMVDLWIVWYKEMLEMRVLQTEFFTPYNISSVTLKEENVA